eukprot:m.89136 g.89136  ORF g.89136 m.89136 type:complete len:370 (+) comp26264_c0_seq1:169-1278(+)
MSSPLSEFASSPPEALPFNVDFTTDGAIKDNGDAASRYKFLKHLGDGTFGTVYRAHDTELGIDVAIKRIKLGSKEQAKEGVHATALREIMFLRELEHENVIQLFSVFSKDTNIHLVLEICDGKDLDQLIKDPRTHLTEANIKSLLLMTCKGMEYLHQHWVLHRDLKPDNLFLTHDGILKVADFGLACFCASPCRAMTSEVVTLWYRAPELLLGAKYYGPGIDMWAIGTIHAEMELGTGFLQGKSEIDQLDKISHALGTLNETSWPGIKLLPNIFDFKYTPPVPLQTYFTAMSKEGIDLITRFLECDPVKRISATEALKHDYFTCEPKPTLPADLPKVQPKEAQKRKRGRYEEAEEDGATAAPLKKTLKF